MKVGAFLSLILLLPIFATSCGNKDKDFYDVTWLNDDDKVLLTSKVKKGDTPKYTGSTPSKSKIKGTTYVFDKWDKELVPIFVDTTYKATYKTIKNFTVKWVNDDGTLLKEDAMVDEMTTPVYKGKTPKKEHEQEKYYYFADWNPKVSQITCDTTYTATYKETTEYSDMDNDGLYDYLDPSPLDNKCSLTLKTKVGDMDEQDLKINTKIDYSLFDNNDNTVYNKDISELGIILNSDISPFSYLSFNDEIGSAKSWDDYTFLYKNRLGCDNVYETITPIYEIDSKDRSGAILAHHRSINNGVTKDYIFITVMASDNQASGWVSNVDVGYDGNNYYKKIDESPIEHKDWDNKDYHKGFYVSAKRLYSNTGSATEYMSVKEYIEYIKKTYPNDKYCVMLSGHSRGASIASIINDFINEEHDNALKVFAYTYACPKTYFGDSISANNIFNIVNEDDAIARFPLTAWGAKRKGTDKVYSISKHLKSVYNRKVGEYSYLSNIDDIESDFAKITNCKRDKIYEINKTNPGFNETYSSNEKRDKDKDKFQKIIDAFNVNKPNCDEYFVVDVSVDKCLKIYNCPAALFMLFGVIKAGEGELPSSYFDLIDLLGNYSTIIDDIISSIGLIELFNTKGEFIAHPHFMTSYYLIINNNVFNE